MTKKTIWMHSMRELAGGGALTMTSGNKQSHAVGSSCIQSQTHESVAFRVQYRDQNGAFGTFQTHVSYRSR